ncbi:MAG: neutral/alkaline non-lysosomal ceramidase N-terminal domain-containing protein [Bacteroidia bacterium]|nr:neutral/alkaline non-lysosomal ceramidase N-terminal domain-containing protein [Bacteroidia bacterium]MDW8088462.1 neutral/alkaline non-lysosomal ceramidase N-terminal domain-containing protein [Bacteroidia bacterium]
MWHVGAARTEITYFEPGIGLMGWGDSRHVAVAIESPLYARAFCLQVAEGPPFFWIEADLCFISIALWQEVFHRLRAHFPNLTPAQLMLTANHTHAAPGGYSHYLLYHINTPGFHPKVFERYVGGFVEAALQAYQLRQPSTPYFNQAPFPVEVPLAFNRAMEAFQKNPQAWTDEPALAVDRTAYQLTFQPQGHLINWFGTHTTTIQRDTKCISSDHKGFAAQLIEEEQNVVAAFAQTTAGDVTPNFRTFPDVPFQRGPTPNPFENRRLVGRYQAEMAKNLARTKGIPLPAELRGWWGWVDFARVPVEEPFTRGKGKGTTGPPALGPAFLGGTAEGPGIPKEWVRLLSVIARLRGLTDPAVQGNKPLLIEGLSKHILGTRRWETLPIPFLDPAIRRLQWLARQRGRYVPLPLLPHILPVQFWQVGTVGILALPMEPTTMAGVLLRERLAPVVAPLGIQHLIIQGYSNGYAGYLTTYWEYQYQRYEGAHTLFGKFTLAAVEKVATQLLKGELEMAEPPPYLSPEQAARVLFTYEVAPQLA